MKKVVILLLISTLTMSAQSFYDHSHCRNPYCLGLLAFKGVNFQGEMTTQITLPYPSEGVKSVSGACNPQLVGCSGGTFTVLLTFDESTVGTPDVSFAVITNSEGYGTSPEHGIKRELIYHVELFVTE